LLDPIYIFLGCPHVQDCHEVIELERDQDETINILFYLLALEIEFQNVPYGTFNYFPSSEFWGDCWRNEDRVVDLGDLNS
jgi:hypothetical protein